jgi:hypothetical protein
VGEIPVARLLTAAAVVVAISIPASMASIAVVNAGPALGATRATCTVFKGTVTNKFTMTKCTPSAGKGYEPATSPTAAAPARACARRPRHVLRLGRCDCCIHHRGGSPSRRRRPQGTLLCRNRHRQDQHRPRNGHESVGSCPGPMVSTPRGASVPGGGWRP